MKRLLWFAVAAYSPLATAEMHGYVLPIATATRVGEPIVSPDNLLGVPALSSEIAYGLRGSLGPFTIRARAHGNLRRVDGKPSIDAEWRLQELSRSVALTEHLSLIAGKRILSWDVSFASTPLGFFQRTPDLSDITDRFERAEGLPLVALAYVGSRTDLSLVYSDDLGQQHDGFNRGLRQLAANFTRNRQHGTYSFVVQKPADQPAGAGFALAVTAAEPLTFHASGFTRRGTRRPISTRVLGRQLVFDHENPNGSWRIGSPERFSHWVAGVSWVASPALSLVLEWNHDDAGLDSREWAFWKELVAFHAQAAPAASGGAVQPAISPDAASSRAPRVDAASTNLAFDAQALLSTGTRQDYLFVRVAHTAGPASFSAVARTGLADASTLLAVSMERSLSSRLAGGVSLTSLIGPGGSELDYMPARHSVQLWLKYAFEITGAARDNDARTD